MKEVILKNISSVPFAFEVTENPMAGEPQISIREDAGLAVPQDMETNEVQQHTQKEAIERGLKAQPQMRERLSTLVKIVIEPGQSMKFGQGQKYNVSQAEYVYKQFGGYGEDSYGNEIVQPVIEINADGLEDKNNFYPRYRAKKSIDVASAQITAKEQFSPAPAKEESHAAPSA